MPWSTVPTRVRAAIAYLTKPLLTRGFLFAGSRIEPGRELARRCGAEAWAGADVHTRPLGRPRHRVPLHGRITGCDLLEATSSQCDGRLGVSRRLRRRGGADGVELQGMSALAERATEPAPERPIKRRVSSPRAVLAVAVLGTFMAFVDATIVNIAIPDIARDLGATSLAASRGCSTPTTSCSPPSSSAAGSSPTCSAAGACSSSLSSPSRRRRRCAPSRRRWACWSLRARAGGRRGDARAELAGDRARRARRRRAHARGGDVGRRRRARRRHRPAARRAADHRLELAAGLPREHPGRAGRARAGRRVLVESSAPGRRRVPDLLGGPLLAAAIADARARHRQGPRMGMGQRSGVRLVRRRRSCSAPGSSCAPSRHRTPVVDLALLRVRSFALATA